MGAWARVENAACARRLSAMADVLERRLAEDGSADRDQWCMDNWDAVACEVAAHHGVSLGAASHQLMIAMALRERLPLVAEVFETGSISMRLVTAIVNRTALIADRHACAKVDVELASKVPSWGALSQEKVEKAIDYWVQRHDEYALRRTVSRARGRHADVSGPDASGTRTLEAELLDHDGAALDKRLDAMARSVCDADPRTIDQRRSDALGAIGPVLLGRPGVSGGRGAQVRHEDVDTARGQGHGRGRADAVVGAGHDGHAPGRRRNGVRRHDESSDGRLPFVQDRARTPGS